MKERDVVLALYAQTVPIMLTYYINNKNGPSLFSTDSPEEAGFVCASFARAFIESFASEALDGDLRLIDIDLENQ